jgi:ADP-ribose pyrophosphatase YjhB (NUDIX family)
MGMASAGRIRPLALAIIRDGERILVFEGLDRLKNQRFYRPLGGGIEFGERGADTIMRELKEEMGADVTDVRYLGTLENVFTYEDKPGHEIVLLFEARLVHAKWRAQERFECKESDKEPFVAVWKSISELRAGPVPVYPEGLLEMLAQ